MYYLHRIEDEQDCSEHYYSSPKIKCFIELGQDYGKVEWGAEPNKEYYVLKILSVEKVDA